MFLRVLNEGNECAFGSRFTNGGSMADSSFFRKTLSRTGTFLSNTLLGTEMFDMTFYPPQFMRAMLDNYAEDQTLSQLSIFRRKTDRR